jgi:hypothetical protein
VLTGGEWGSRRQVPGARKRSVLAAIDGHAAGVPANRDRVEFRHFGRLACGIWSDFLDEEVARRMQSPDPGIRRRATWVAEAAVSAGRA